jgi:chromosomal replication initiation ATPase DnaA
LSKLLQLSFEFQSTNNPDPFCEENFLFLEENLAAVNFLKKFFIQDAFYQGQFPSLIIRGARASGKTHLLHIFAGKFHAEFIDQKAISAVNLAGFFLAQQFYILENIDKIKDEELLLRLINSAAEAKAFLILTVRDKPQFNLLDLTSRLKNIFTVEIKNPGCESIKQLLTNNLSRRQIKLSRSIINFIAANISSNYETVLMTAKMIELYCRENGRNLTVREAKIMFKKS